MDSISPRAKIDKSYELINSKYSMSVNQTKIVLTALSLIRPDDTEFRTYRIPVSEFKWLVENGNYSRLKSECRKLMSQVLEVPEDDGGWSLYNWFSKMRYIPKDGVIEVRMDEDLKPYLLQLKNNFSSVYLMQLMKLSSEYAIRIYEMCNQYKKIGRREIKLQELHELFQTPKSYQKLYNDFKKRVLEIAKKDINEKTDLTIEYEEIKVGRKVTAIKFIIKSKKQTMEENQDMMPTLFDDVDIVEEHMTISDFMAVPAQRNILVDGKTYHIKNITIKNNKYVIETERGDLPQTHKNQKKLLTALIQWNNAYKA